MKDDEKRNLSKIFNMNTILTNIITYSAYIVLVGSIVILVYLSFIKKLGIQIDVVTLTIFSFAVVFLSFVCWNMFYHKQYEKVMSEDIEQIEKGKYSIHARYYIAIKDWEDEDLQKAIDKFNDEYTKKWLRYVEKKTGKPIETYEEKLKNENGTDKLDENGKPIYIKILGIKDLPYKGFKHKLLMWRIKKHRYPESGYKTSMELRSLFSFQESNLNRRKLNASSVYYRSRSILKLFFLMLLITSGASLVPEIVEGSWLAVALKLGLGIGALLSGTISGALNGVKGARIKLSVVEDVCFDLETWKGVKPMMPPYQKDGYYDIQNGQNIEVKPQETNNIENIFKKS